MIGGGGFIGKSLVGALLAADREVLVLGRRIERPAGLPAPARYEVCDCADRTRLRGFIRDCDEIVDLAYATVPKTSFADPIRDLRSNLEPAVILLEEASKVSGLRRLVITSSGGTVYGPVLRLPIVEDDRTTPISPYGITKLTIEHYAFMFNRLSGLPVTILRPANAYGPAQRPFTGQGFVATAMGRIIRREPVTIFGDVGTVRDYIHVRDVAAGIVSALQSGHPGEVYNVGSGVGRSNLEVIKLLEPLAARQGLPVVLTHEPARGFDVPANVLSYAKLLHDSDWRPRIAFEDGLREMWQQMLVLPELRAAVQSGASTTGLQQ